MRLLLRANLKEAVSSLTASMQRSLLALLGISIGIGSVTAQLALDTQADNPTDQVKVWLDGLRARLDEQQGFAVVESAPEALITQIDVWGAAPSAGLLKLYKSRFDPQSLLNPGRYVGGL